MRKKVEMLFLVFIAAFFCFSFNVHAAIKGEGGTSYCVFCDRSDPERYKWEMQLIDRINAIKEAAGNDSINEIALAATIFHKEDSLKAVKSRYKTNFDKDKFKNNMDSIFKESSGSSEEATNNVELDEDSGITEGQVDLLEAAAIVMKSSAEGGKYNEEKYKEALAGDTLTPNVGVEDTIFCASSAIGSGLATIGDTVFSVGGNQPVTSGRWYDREKMCSNGYIGGAYNITKDTVPDEATRKARKEAIANEIIDLVHFYCNLSGDCEEEEENTDVCAVPGSSLSGNTQAKDFKAQTQAELFDEVGPSAMIDYNSSGIFASVTLAQLRLESGFPLSQLAIQNNNLFGIKCNGYNSCTDGWNTSEYENGGYIQIQDSFRKYKSVEESIGDHSNFLKVNSRYVTAGVFDAKTPEEQITRIWQAGYATDPVYVQSVMSLINENNLTKWDKKGSSANTNNCIGDYDYNGTVTNMMQKVVDEAKARATGIYDNGCEAWAEEVWTAATGLTRNNQNSAYDAWLNFKVSTSKDNIPPGAMVYGSGSHYCVPGECYPEPQNPYGHVGIYAGNGKVVDQGGVQDLEAWINWQSGECHGHIGWYGWGWYNNVDLTKKS